MIKRTIYIGNPGYLKIKQNQLIIQDPESGTVKGTIPVEDIAVLMLDHYQISLTNQLIIRLQGNNTTVVSCDEHHLPLGIMLPLYGHSEHSERMKYQLEASEPLKKQLWKQTVERKIRNQQSLLKIFKKPYLHMDHYIQNIKSGDATNMEAKAAQFYWKNLFDDFTRERYGSAPNHLLNFGYAVLRSMVARALVNSGLLPVLGIFHKNKYNPYCLADDVMEPYRPFVDKMIFNYTDHYGLTNELTREIKAYILTIATQDVIIDGVQRPLMIAISITTSSLFKCYTGEIRQIKYPVLD